MAKINKHKNLKKKRNGICGFILEKLDDDNFNQIQWTNKEKGEFCIHWMHASSGMWNIKNTELFRLWAEHKGKLKPKEENYKTWKTNFRCAMKSRFELEELKVPKWEKNRFKDLKLWRFKDVSLVTKYKDGLWPRSYTRKNTKNKTSNGTKESKRENMISFENDDTMTDNYNSDSGVSELSDMNEIASLRAVSEDEDFNLEPDDDTKASLLDILAQDHEAEEELRKASKSLNPMECDRPILYNDALLDPLKDYPIKEISQRLVERTPSQSLETFSDITWRGYDLSMFDDSIQDKLTVIKIPNIVFEGDDEPWNSMSRCGDENFILRTL